MFVKLEKEEDEEKYKQFNNFVPDVLTIHFCIQQTFVKHLLYSRPQEYKDDYVLVLISKVHILAY